MKYAQTIADIILSAVGLSCMGLLLMLAIQDFRSSDFFESLVEFVPPVVLLITTLACIAMAFESYREEREMR